MWTEAALMNMWTGSQINRAWNGVGTVIYGSSTGPINEKGLVNYFYPSNTYNVKYAGFNYIKELSNGPLITVNWHQKNPYNNYICVAKNGGIAFVTADHGNLDEMFEIDAKSGSFIKDSKTGKYKSKTAHTLNPVPMIIYDPQYNGEYELNPIVQDPGLGNVAATLLNLLGYDVPDDYLPSLIKYKA